MGFRDTAIVNINLDPERKTVLFIGDSHTEGVGVLYRDCFPNLIQKENRDLQVFNASAVSYSPRLYYLKAKHLIEEQNFIPDEIFVMIDISDIQNEIIYKRYIEEKKFLSSTGQHIYEFFHRHSLIYYRSKNIISGIQQRKFARESEVFREYVQKSNFEETFSLYVDFFDNFDDKVLLSDPNFHNVGSWLYDEEYLPLLKKGLELGAENILKLKKLCDEYEIKLSLSVHPWKEQISKGMPTDMYVNFWKYLCEEENIPFLNLYPAFIWPKINMITSGGFFIPNDNHWNEAGHRIVAMELGDFLGETKKRGKGN
jgi:lysophospholipase L1-like esterase